MYKSENDKVNELVKVFIEKGLFSVQDDGEHDVCADDMYYFEHVCTPENLDACIHEAKELKDATSAWKWLRDSGLLNCSPVLVGDSLVYGFQKYMHWFRGYYYQVSYTKDGDGSREHSYSRLDLAIKGVTIPEAIHQLLAAALLVTALRYRKQTQKLLDTEDGVKLLEDVLNSDLNEHYPRCHGKSYGLRNLLQYVKVSRAKYFDTYVDDEDTKVVQLGAKSANPARSVMVLSKEKIIVVTKEGSNYVTHELSVPEWVYSLDEDGFPMIENHVPVMELLTEFLLSYSGVRLGITGVYNVVDRKGSVKADCVTQATSAQDVFDIIEEFYSE